MGELANTHNWELRMNSSFELFERDLLGVSVWKIDSNLGLPLSAYCEGHHSSVTLETVCSFRVNSRDGISKVTGPSVGEFRAHGISVGVVTTHGLWL